MQMQMLARAYHVKWTVAAGKRETIDKLVEQLDGKYVEYVKNPRLAEADPETWNADWFGLGPSGDVLRLIATEVQPLLDQPIAGLPDGSPLVTRRVGYADMLVACRDWHRRHRRLYTNQSMINDLYGIYLANRGVAVIDPKRALSEDDAKRYLYESVGLQPWLDSDPGGDGAPEVAGRKNWSVGPNYMQLTAKGLTRELGYVGSYGEVIDWVVAIYNATRPTPDAPGDERIRAQLIKIAKARSIFRYPGVDADGHRAMFLESTVGWRDTHYPGDVTYAQRSTWDAGPLEAAAVTGDRELLGYAAQMLDDNQFFDSQRLRMENTGLRVTAGLLATPDSYDAIVSRPRTGAKEPRLPMSPGQPDTIFSDEEDGVVAIKHGDDVLYASLYYRARFGINRLARVHLITSTIERDATVWLDDVKFDDSGMVYHRDGRVNEAQTTRHEKNLKGIEQALEGETMPIAKIPDGIAFKPGQENVYAGKGTFYVLRYGDYLLAMNMTTDRTFDFTVPSDAPAHARDLVNKQPIGLTPGQKISVGPRSTCVLWLGQSTEQR
ncbi:MAG: hypothetical protein QM770_21195 [Tepidisphaeraceae bacterium]